MKGKELNIEVRNTRVFVNGKELHGSRKWKYLIAGVYFAIVAIIIALIAIGTAILLIVIL